jgi:F0F1-type ATP synthase membrane subunit b/b'
MSSPANPKSTARKSRNDSPAPKSAAGKPAVAAAKPEPKKDESKKEEKNICGLHPEAFRALILAPLAVVAVIVVVFFLDYGSVALAFVQKHWSTLSAPAGNILVEHKDAIVMVTLSILASPLVVVFLATVLRAAADVTHLNTWQKALVGGLVVVALGLRMRTAVAWDAYPNHVCSDTISSSSDSHCKRACIRNQECIAVTQGAEGKCILCKTTEMANATEDLATYVMPQALQDARVAVQKTKKVAEERAKALKQTAEKALADAEKKSEELKKQAQESAKESKKAAEEKAAALIKAAEDALEAVKSSGEGSVEAFKQRVQEAKDQGEKLVADVKAEAKRAKQAAAKHLSDAKEVAKNTKARADQMVTDATEGLKSFYDHAKDASIGYVNKVTAREYWDWLSDPIEDLFVNKADNIIAGVAILCLAPLVAAVVMYTLRALWGCRLQIVNEEPEEKTK